METQEPCLSLRARPGVDEAEEVDPMDPLDQRLSRPSYAGVGLVV
jgi:hypothetical protein